MLKHLKDFGLYCLSLFIGFIGINLSFHLAIALGLFEINETLYESGTLWQSYFIGTTNVWLFSGLLGLLFFFWRKEGRYWILLLPALLPSFYGLSVLVKLGASLSTMG